MPHERIALPPGKCGPCREPLPDREHEVNMIRHDGPGMNPCPGGINRRQGFRDDAGDIRPCQPGATLFRSNERFIEHQERFRLCLVQQERPGILLLHTRDSPFHRKGRSPETAERGGAGQAERYKVRPFRRLLVREMSWVEILHVCMVLHSSR